MVCSRPSRFSLFFFFLSLLSTLRPVYLIRIFLSFSGVYSRAFVRALCVCVCKLCPVCWGKTHRQTHIDTHERAVRDTIIFSFPPLCVLRTWEWREREKKNLEALRDCKCGLWTDGFGLKTRREREQQPCRALLLEEFSSSVIAKMASAEVNSFRLLYDYVGKINLWWTFR
jgi:hypothetical protein